LGDGGKGVEEQGDGPDETLEREVRAVLRAVRGTNVEELRLAWADVRIAVRRELPPGAAPPSRAGEAGAGALAEPEAPARAEVRAHMVGPFHRSREPDGPVLVEEGDRVEAGAPLGVIETLGMATEVEAPAAGRLERFLVEDGQPVEFGQVVAVIEPEG
jgi:acetyl-CoA carboxylase biotin carboxyl carrier protein